MSTLLIWQEVPESNKFYVLRNVTAEQKKDLKLAHGRLIGIQNSNKVDAALDRISQRLCGEEDTYEDPIADLGCWVDCKINEDQLLTDGPFDRVILTGIVM